MLNIRYVSFGYGVVFLLLVIGYIFGFRIEGLSLQQQFNLPDIVLYTVTALAFILSKFIARNTERIFESVGLIYVLFSVLGFVLAPNGGLLFGALRVDQFNNWLHLILGTSSFILSWISNEVRFRRLAREHHRNHSSPMITELK